MPEYSPHILDQLRLERDIEEILARDRRAYRERSAEEREWLNQDSPKRRNKLSAKTINKFVTKHKYR